MPELRVLGHPDERRALRRLAALAPNVENGGGPGWYEDDYRQPLPAGTWEIARALVAEYAFADPSMVRAVFDASAPLEGRDMLLELRFAGLRLYVGVRVAAVRDETRRVGDREARVWGWDYVTLEGHLEAGRRSFEVWEWQDTGEVEFRTHAAAGPAVENPVLRLGFRLFGRHRRAEFGRTACERMARLAAARVSPAAGGQDREGMDGSRLTAIYLDDHLAMLVVAEELAKRMLGASRDADIKGFVRDVLSDVRDDKGAAEGRLRELGRTPSRLKQGMAWIGEKAGRLKTNGNPRGYSPLTRYVELEGLGLVLAGNRARWSALEHAGPEEWREDAGRRAARADERLGRAEELRLVAAETTFAGGGRRL